MTVEDFTFPQNGDADFAENFGTWLGRSNITDYVEEGLDVSITDTTSPEATITEGKAFVSQDSKEISSVEETRLTLDYCVIRPETTVTSTEGLTDGEINYIFLRPNLDTNDSPEYVVFSGQNDGDPNDLLLAEVDLIDDTVEEFNRNPSMVSDSLVLSVNLGIPVYSDTSNAETGEGNLIFIDGNGSEDSGLYVYNGSDYNKVGLETISELSDVSGITGLEENTESNRPSAGTEGRIFFNTTANSVEYDDGGSWQVIGADPAGISAGDLGFDPATQQELDDHASDGDAHHSKTATIDELDDVDLTDIEVGLQADRPTAGTNGRLYIARDSNRIYYDNGSSWRLVGLESHDDLTDVDSDDHHIRPEAGTNLSEDGSNNFNVVQGDGSGLDADTLDTLEPSDIRVDVEDAGTVTVSGATAINFDANLNVSDDGDGTVTVDAQSSTDTRTDVSENGDTIVSDTEDINFIDSGSAFVNVDDDGDGGVTVDVGASDSDTTYSAGNALTLSGTEFNVNEGSISHDNISGVSSSDHHSRYSDSEARSAINNDSDHGSTASHDYYTDSEAADAAPVQSVNNSTGDVTVDTFSGSHDDLSDVGSSDHHSKYTDNEAVSAVEDHTGGFSMSSDIDMGNSTILTSAITVSNLDAVGTTVTVRDDFTVNGSKDFEIEHPSDPERRLRHAAYEGPVTGGLIYRDRVTVEDRTAEPNFPNYVLNGDFGDDWVTSITPVNHFGSAYLDTDEWTVHADEDGEYDVVILGRRTDENALSGRGAITEKGKDENWNEVAEKFHNGNGKAKGVENARGKGRVEKRAKEAHGRSRGNNGNGK